MPDTVRLPQRVVDIAKCQQLLPKESQFIGRKGYYRHYNKDGSYRWGFKYRPNVDGKTTKIGGEILDSMRPFMRADVARHQKLEAEKRRVAVRDGAGQIRMLEPHLAERARLEHGWGTPTVRGASKLYDGEGGMLWRRRGDEWQPTGRRCLGRPLFGSAFVSKLSVQYDPDGNPWRWIAKKWRRVT